MKSIKAKDIKFYKNTKAKIKSKEYLETCWSGRMWDPVNRQWRHRKTDFTNRAQAEEQAIEIFTDLFSQNIRSIAAKKNFNGEPLSSDLIALYHETCAALPSESVRNQNVNALKRCLEENGAKNPLAQRITVLTPKLFRQWFNDRIEKREAACDGDVFELDAEKHTLKSDWGKIRCILKKDMINAREDEGWPEAVWRHLKDLRKRVSTTSLYAPFDNGDFEPVSDELVAETWKRFKAVKYTDPNLYIVFLLGAGGGLRFKEATHVRWDDLGEDTVRVAKHGRRNTKGKRSRTVTVPAFVINEIREFQHDQSGPFGEYCVSHPTPLKKLYWNRKVDAMKFKPQRREQKGRVTWRIAYKYTTLSCGARSPKYLTFQTKNEALAKQKELLKLQTEKSYTATAVRTVGGKACTRTERGDGNSGNKHNVHARINAILNELGWSETGLVTTGKKFHKLRAWNITQVIENEDLYTAQKHAGHVKASTTATYYDTGVKKESKEYIGKMFK